MATAEELLAQSTSSDDRICVIDLDTRVINIPKSIVALGVESDAAVKRLDFQMPSTYRGTDLSGFNIRVIYSNANNEEPEFWDIPNRTVSDGTIRFSWTVEREVVKYRGNVRFIVCLRKANTSTGEVEQELNTTIASLPVLEGMEADVEGVTDSTFDPLAQLQGVYNTHKDNLDTTYNTHKGNLDKEYGTHSGNLDKEYGTHSENLTNTATILSNNFGKQYGSRANAIVKSEEGSVISVNDASDDYLRGFRVFGKSNQNITTGAQVCELPDVTHMTSAGITWTCKDGVVTANGTSTGTSSTSGSIECSLTGRVGTFSVSGSTSKVNVYCAVTKDGTTKWYNSQTFTLDGTETQVVVYCQVFSAGVSVNDIIYPMVNSGAQILPWEPYSGGHPSPSPNWPQQITHAPVNVGVLGANILDVKSLDASTNTSLSVSDDGYSIAVKGGTKSGWTSSVYELPSDIVKILRGHKIYISYDTFTSEQNVGARAGFNVTLENGVTEYPSSIGPTYKEVSIVIPNNAKKLLFAIYANNTGTALASDNTVTIKGLRVSLLNRSDWVPYQDIQRLSVTTPSGIPGIPVSTGGNYTDENGQQWVCDEIDFERGKYIQRITEKVYNGSSGELWAYVPTNGDQKTPVFCVTVPGISENPPASGRATLCDSYLHAFKLPISNREYWAKSTYFGSQQFAFRNDSCANVDEWMRYLADHPITITHDLATPIEHDLTTDELAAYSALHTNYPNTTVVNDAGAWMELKYNADTQKTLENTFRPTDEQVQNSVNTYLDNKPAASIDVKNRILRLSYTN